MNKEHWELSHTTEDKYKKYVSSPFIWFRASLKSKKDPHAMLACSIENNDDNYKSNIRQFLWPKPRD